MELNDDKGGDKPLSVKLENKIVAIDATKGREEIEGTEGIYGTTSTCIEAELIVEQPSSEEIANRPFAEYGIQLEFDDANKTTEPSQQIELANSRTETNVEHSSILRQLLSEVQPIDLRAAIGIPADMEMREKHYQFAVVKVLLDLSKSKKWNLSTKDEYIYVYNGAYWKQHNKAEIRKFLSDASIKMGMPDYQARIHTFVDGLVKQFLSDAYFPAPEPDDKKILINLQNGTFEFSDGKWIHKSFDPNDFLTYQLPFSYDPKADSPQFNDYLSKVLPDDCSQMVLQEFAGYIFTKMNLERCLLLTGSGSNGKSVYFNIINALVGRENTLNYSLSLFGHEGNRAKLSNVLMNYSSETAFKLSPEIFKALVSGEPLQARELYCKPFTLHNKVKFIMNSNGLPRETENTEAYFRRFLIVPFDVTIKKEERDIELADRIIAHELPGVFNWLLKGLERIVQNKQFSPCKKADSALAEFQKQSDTVQLFLDEYNYQPSTTHKESLKSLYFKYEDLCRGDKLLPMGRTKFSMELEKRGFEKKRANAGYLISIELKALE